MQHLQADVAIIGAGFSGSLTALLLQKIGLRPALVEKGSHPRFAIGESSTPMADLLLKELADRYDLPRLRPLAKYGTWQVAYPNITCGLKRGFSYFRHTPDAPYTPLPRHGNELLLAASNTDAEADTHWFRPEFDEFFIDEVQAAGIPYIDRCELTSLTTDSGSGWTIQGVQGDAAIDIKADFVIDASGEAGAVARALGISTAPTHLKTTSRVLFGHFTGVGSWHDILTTRGGQTGDHPFCCDHAALHHILDGGWMYVLPFNNGVTSAGFMLDTSRHPRDDALSAEEEWNRLMTRYPSVGEQFAKAQVTPLCGSLRRTHRLQRRAAQCVGPNWAMLPLSTYSLDALHSTGNAHTLSGIERLVHIFETTHGREEFAPALQAYGRNLQAEIDHIDEIVHGCYAAFCDFDLLAAYAAFYFAAATTSESRRCHRGRDLQCSFLLSHDPIFRQAVHHFHERVVELGSRPRTTAEVQQFASDVTAAIRPYNIAGLCDPARQNMYPYLCEA